MGENQKIEMKPDEIPFVIPSRRLLPKEAEAGKAMAEKLLKAEIMKPCVSANGALSVFVT